VRLSLRFDESVPEIDWRRLRIKADLTRWTDVVKQLIYNAVSSTSDHGTVEVYVTALRSSRGVLTRAPPTSVFLAAPEEPVDLEAHKAEEQVSPVPKPRSGTSRSFSMLSSRPFSGGSSLRLSVSSVGNSFSAAQTGGNHGFKPLFRRTSVGNTVTGGYDLVRIEFRDAGPGLSEVQPSHLRRSPQDLNFRRSCTVLVRP